MSPKRGVWFGGHQEVIGIGSEIVLVVSTLVAFVDEHSDPEGGGALGAEHRSLRI